MKSYKRVIAVELLHGGTWAALDLARPLSLVPIPVALVPAGLEVGTVGDDAGDVYSHSPVSFGSSRLLDHARVRQLDLLLQERVPTGFNDETRDMARRRGRAEGIVEGISYQYRLAPRIVEPMEWRRELGLSGTKQDAGASVAMAMDLIGKVGGFNSMRPDEADVILLAWWGRKYL